MTWLLPAAAAFFLVLRAAVAGTLPGWAAAVLVPAAFSALVVATVRTAAGLGITSPRPAWRRHGFWVVLLGAWVSLPTLGSFSLVDPWETHYAEVAREMIERHDFISPWWANEGWFRSKPVLLFWLEAAAMRVLGVRTAPDRVLELGARPEWAVRLPGALLAIVAVYILYYGISRTCTRRAGLLGAVALWTMPGFALLTHQALTDTPMIACVAASLGFLLRALETTDEPAPPWAARVLAVAIAGVTVPQLVLLALEHGRHGVFAVGSPHACGLPSQPGCGLAHFAHPQWRRLGQLALFAALAGWLLVRVASTQRRSHLFALAAAGCAALATMAKGPVGLVVPAAALLAALVAKRSLRPLLRLDLVASVVLVLTCVAPWYVAVWARHGRAFLDELVVRNMLGRTLEHLHDTNEGEDTGFVYFVRQLGYATFPWCGLLAVVAPALPRPRDVSYRNVTRPALLGAASCAFVLVSAMHTKFHHYALVALPPLAMLVGLWLDERLTAAEHDDADVSHVAVVLAAAAGLTALVAHDLAGAGENRLMFLVTYRYARSWPGTHGLGRTFPLVGGAVGLGLLVLGSVRARRAATLWVGLVAVVFSVFVLDVYLPRAAPNGGQRHVLEAYYRARDPGSSQPLIAYQLNWKGENFYTGNHLAIFKSSGAAMVAWLTGRRQLGERTWFFVLETGRIATLRSELGSTGAFDVLTGAAESTEFVLVRVTFVD